MVLQFSFWVFTLKRRNDSLEGVFSHPCSWQRYLVTLLQAKATQYLLTDEQISKMWPIHTCKRIVLSPKKEGNSDTRSSADKP